MHSAICATPRMASAKVTVGFFSMLGPDDWRKTELFVNWGANPENSVINRAGTPKHRPERARREVCATWTSGPCATHWAPRRTLGSPSDRARIAPWRWPSCTCSSTRGCTTETSYPSGATASTQLAEHVRQFPPEWAAPVTGLPAGQIRDTARLIGTTRPAFIMMGNGVGDQTSDGTATVVGHLSDSRDNRQYRRTGWSQPSTGRRRSRTRPARPGRTGAARHRGQTGRSREPGVVPEESLDRERSHFGLLQGPDEHPHR